MKPFKAHWMNDLPWENETEEFSVCGATVRFVHLKPLVDGDSGKTKTKKNFLFLHGKPGWSYVWRNVSDIRLIFQVAGPIGNTDGFLSVDVD